MATFPRRLQHHVPGWVKDGALYHIRIRCSPHYPRSLADPDLAPKVLEAAQRYHTMGRWWCEMMLLMPDHLHALLAFPGAPGMAMTVRDWKRGVARFQGVQWQDNFFDHRIRHEKEGNEKWLYIRQNPDLIQTHNSG